MMRKKSFFGFVFAFMFAIMNLQAVTVHAATIHVVEEWERFKWNGRANLEQDFQNGDTISLEKLKQWNENRVKVEIPSEIHALTIHGLPEVTYEYIGFTAVSYVAITLDNFNGHNNISGGAGDLLTFSSPTGNQLVLKEIIMLSEIFTATLKCWVTAVLNKAIQIDLLLMEIGAMLPLITRAHSSL